MTDDDYMLLIFLILSLGVLVISQLLATRRLKKRVSALELQVTQPAQPGRPPDVNPAVTRGGEVDELRKRIQVLERIATDGNPVLEREIEELRSAG